MKRLFITLLCLYSLAASSQQIGTVLLTLNKVIAEQNGSQRVLTRGAAINSGDVIITNSDSEAKIKYTNGTMVSIAANSNFQTNVPGAKNPNEFNAVLNEGAIEYNSHGKKKGTLKTPVVALAISGTKVAVQAAPGKPTTGTVMINGKKVTFKNGQFLVNGKRVAIKGRSILVGGKSVRVSPIGKIFLDKGKTQISLKKGRVSVNGIPLAKGNYEISQGKIVKGTWTGPTLSPQAQSIDGPPSDSGSTDSGGNNSSTAGTKSSGTTSSTDGDSATTGPGITSINVNTTTITGTTATTSAPPSSTPPTTIIITSIT